MSQRSSIIRKIEALLRLAKGNGTEAEMLSAMAKAQELINLHKIEEGELGNKRSSVELSELMECDFNFERNIILAVCSLNAVMPIFDESGSYALVGTPENVELSKLLMNFVFEQVDDLLIENDFKNGQKNESFANGLSIGIMQQCTEIRNGLKASSEKGQWLVVTKKEEEKAVNEFIHQKFGNGITTKPTSLIKPEDDVDAMIKGILHGQEVQINKELSND